MTYDAAMIRDFWQHLKWAYRLTRALRLRPAGRAHGELVETVQRLQNKYGLPAWAFLTGGLRDPGPLGEALEYMEALDPYVAHALEAVDRAAELDPPPTLWFPQGQEGESNGQAQT